MALTPLDTTLRASISRPDVVHIMMDGRIVMTGDADLAARLEKEGYAHLAEELGIDYQEEV